MSCDYTFGLSLVTAPASEPITLNEAKAQCRVELDNTYDDTYIGTLIVSAREYLEKAMGRRFINSTWDLVIDYPLPDYEISMPYSPLSSVTSFSYIDSGGTTQTWASTNYGVDTYSAVGRIYRAFGVVWPVTRDIQQAVTIRHVAGYGATATSVPANIKHAMKLLVSHHYEIRAPEIVGSTVAKVQKSLDALMSLERTSWL